MLVLLMVEITKCAVEMVAAGMVYLPSVIQIGSGIQVVLRLLPQQFVKLQCWYY
jgi:hypothetical protein